MSSIVSPNLAAAQESLAIAADSRDRVYHSRTSLLAVASAHEHMQNYSAALDDTYELRSNLTKGNVSWWHYIQQQLLVGRTLILIAGSYPTPESIRQGFHALGTPRFKEHMKPQESALLRLGIHLDAAARPKRCK